MKPQLHLIHCNERVLLNKEDPLEEWVMVRTSEEFKEPLLETEGMQKGVNKMLPILIGLALATVFGLMVHVVYGTTGLAQKPWVYSVICSMITAGVVISLLQTSTPCLAFRVFRRIRITGLAGRVGGDCA